ncbi:MAG: SidA/IucD/PvdA family monooxygenase, partial [Candidatus Obscuribacterales bacterium]|nr:SidA/IucD/PvdA family monooxygenase [Candidatus Obscuribacterales bacterium]
GFSEFFYSLPADRKEQVVQQQTLASDGISLSLLEQIYQRLYFLECIEKREKIVDFIPGHKLEQIEKSGESYKLVLSRSNDSDDTVVIDADIIILATGYKWQLPAYLGGLNDRIPLDENGNFLVNKDYSIEWDGPDQHRIYVQNGARHSHGVADPNLSLMAWRSATIINSIAESQVYDLDGESSAMDWQVLARQQMNFNPPVQRGAQTAIQLPFGKEGARLVSRV